MSDGSVARSGEAELELIDLRDRQDEGLLDALYHELFVPNFPDPDEGEDPSIWAPLLWGEPDPSQPVLHALVAGKDLTSPQDRELMALVLCEFYRRSSCGLLSYVATRPGLRGRGLGRWLVEQSIGALRADAAADGRDLRAFFAEIHDPAKIDPSEDVFDPTSRLEVMERLGARLVPVSYVQPELRPGLNRSDRLLLVAFPIDGAQHELPAETVRDFLEDLYRALGVADPDGDADYARMRSELGAPTVSLSAVRAERPALRFGKYAIALHFALVPSGDAPVDVPESDINFGSFERDMLSYSYRKEPRLFSSRLVPVPEDLRTVELRFPRRLRYEAEGEQVQLICPASPGGARRRQLDVKASRTDFGSGVSVLHLVLVPADSEAASLTEYDLVKIAKLWERGEGVDTFWGDELDEVVAVGAPGGDGPTRSVKACAESVFRTQGLSLDGPRVGTVELLTEEEEWERIWAAKTSGADEPAPELVSVGGIVQCLLDFTRISADELEDVFAPLDFDHNGLLGIHKGTLLSIATADRVYEQAAPSIGMSPYLLLSQAVLLHNEIQLEKAGNAYNEVTKRSEQRGDANGRAEQRRPIRAAWRLVRRRQRSNKQARLLAETERAMHRALNVYYLPNVFQYEGERRPYETGATSRALSDHREDLREKLREVHGDWEHENARRREYAEDVMNLVLVFITAIGLHSVFEDVSVWYFVGAAVLFAAFYIRRRKL